MSAASAPVPVASAARASSRRGTTVDPSWDELAALAPQLVATMIDYLDQLAVSSRPATVTAASLVLRQFTDHLTSVDPACRCVAGIGVGGFSAEMECSAFLRRGLVGSNSGVPPLPLSIREIR